MRRDETFSIDQRAVVHVDLAGGDVLVKAGTSGRVAVSIDSSSPDSVDVSQAGDTISIRGRGRGRSARIALDVPVGSDVSVKGASLDVTTRGALGALTVRSASGDVSADDVVRAEIALASGDIRLDLVRHDAQLRTTSGDVSAGSVGGRLGVSLSSGDLRADEVGGDADIESASGDITIRRCDGSSIAVRSVSGDIRLGLPPGIRVDPEITTMSGKVVLPQPAQRATGNAERRHVRVRLRSVSGDIRIERAG